MRSNRIEGLGVDLHQARFTGTFDVSEQDDEVLGLDSVVVFLVAARSGKIEHTIRDSGDVVAKRILKISEAVPLTGEEREQAIRQMTKHVDPNQGSFGWAVTPGSLDAEHPALRNPEPQVEVEEDEAPEEFIPQSYDSDMGDVEIVGQIKPHRKDRQLDNFLRESYQ